MIVPQPDLVGSQQTEQEAQMPRESIDKVKDGIDELEAENEALRDQVDAIGDIIEGEKEDKPACGEGWQ